MAIIALRPFIPLAFGFVGYGHRLGRGNVEARGPLLSSLSLMSHLVTSSLHLVTTGRTPC